MKIGIFDSGLGGLIIAKAIFKKLPPYDYIYLGDTKNLPYGSKTQKQIFNFTRSAVDFLFARDCQVVIVACNTSSASALRKIQRQYLPKAYPNRRVLGVVVPTLEAADEHHAHKKIGVIGTKATVNSHKYKTELTKIDKWAKIYELATPDLVPLIEKNALPKAKNALKLYLETLQKMACPDASSKVGVQALILGCTHYPILKNEAKKILGPNVPVVSQDEIIPNKLADYLKRNGGITKKLSHDGKREFLVTKVSPGFKAVAKRLFGKNIELKLVSI